VTKSEAYPIIMSAESVRAAEAVQEHRQWKGGAISTVELAQIIEREYQTQNKKRMVHQFKAVAHSVKRDSLTQDKYWFANELRYIPFSITPYCTTWLVLPQPLVAGNEYIITIEEKEND